MKKYSCNLFANTEADTYVIESELHVKILKCKYTKPSEYVRNILET